MKPAHSLSYPWLGFGATDIGRVRKLNQDAFAVRNDLQLWVVADGMGGHAGGEIASQIAVQAITDFIESSPPVSPREATSLEYERLLVRALEHANQAIREESQRKLALQGMGTTAVTVLIVSGDSRNELIVAHAGDSRLYLFRKGKLILWTRDHTLMEERLALNLITPEQVRTHPQRHILTKALGIDSPLLPTVRTYELEVQDKLLLCSDGLTKMLTDEEIQSVLLKKKTAALEPCEELIESANRLGGEDNITLILIGRDENQNP